MHTVEMLAQALDAARRLGYRVRQEWLGGNGGGACELKGRRILFLDLALGPAEQLQQVLDALRSDPKAAGLSMPTELREMVRVITAFGPPPRLPEPVKKIIGDLSNTERVLVGLDLREVVVT
jgi:hypothetical protein